MQCYRMAVHPPVRLPIEKYASLMLDMLTDAMRCDLTRVGTFMFGNGGSNRVEKRESTSGITTLSSPTRP